MSGASRSRARERVLRIRVVVRRMSEESGRTEIRVYQFYSTGGFSVGAAGGDRDTT